VRTITALRERPRATVEVDLDGQRWRALPADAVVRCGLAVGRPLDRATARELAREVRRSRAVGVAVRALRHRDLSRRVLGEKLPAPAREQALETLERSGYLDDARAAGRRAAALGGRGWGDEAIRFQLEQEGFGAEETAGALAALEAESKRAQAFRERGRSERWLAAHGFEVASPE